MPQAREKTVRCGRTLRTKQGKSNRMGKETHLGCLSEPTSQGGLDALGQRGKIKFASQRCVLSAFSGTKTK